jgi:hypothetical protein
MNSIVSKVSDPAAVAAIGTLTQIIEYQRRDLGTLAKELRDTRSQLLNLGTSVNNGYLHMSDKFEKMYNRFTLWEQTNEGMFPNNLGNRMIMNVHNPVDVDIPRAELELQVPVPTIVINNQPTTATATEMITETTTETTTEATVTVTTTATTANMATAINGEATPTELARAAGINAVTRLRASNDPHLPNMSLMFPVTWSALLAEWRVEHLSDFDRKGVPSSWKDSGLQQRYAKRLRCIRLIRRIATMSDVSEAQVVEDLDRILNAVDNLTVSKHLIQLEKQDSTIKRRVKK